MNEIYTTSLFKIKPKKWWCKMCTKLNVIYTRVVYEMYKSVHNLYNHGI